MERAGRLIRDRFFCWRWTCARYGELATEEKNPFIL